MPSVTTTDGIELAYHRQGDGPPVLLVMGLGAQRTVWPQELVDQLAAEGLDVISLDNRDVGLSTSLDELGPVDPGTLMAALTGQVQVPPPYTLGDMAGDAVALLDELGIDSAHVVGASMGGMIAQHVAFDHPTRTRSLVSIMSTTGAPGVGTATPEAAQALLAPSPPDRDAYIARSVQGRRVIGSRTHVDDDRAAQLAGELYDRSYRPDAAGRQLLAIIADGDRTARLARVEAPTLVIHGAEDPLVQPDGGEATAAAVPGSRLEMVAGMGHDMPLPLIGDLVRSIADHVLAAEG